MTKSPAAPPKHLSASSKTFWRAVLARFELDDEPGQELLRLACEARDRCEQARAMLDADGLTVVDRYGQVKPHPAATIEAQNRIAVARLLRELRVTEPLADDRSPRLGEIK